MLTVLNVAYPFAPVSREAVGGPEQVLAAIDEALVAAGHRSLVMACRGSSVAGELLAVEATNGTVDESTRRRLWDVYKTSVNELLKQRSVDVVHLHGVDAAEYLPETQTPTVLTLHLPVDSYPKTLLRSRPGLYLTCVSSPQRQIVEAEVPVHATIENGVDLDRFKSAPGSPAGFALCLGRICPEKGIDVALRAARRGRMTMVLAGGVLPDPEHERYLAREIVPLLDQRRRYVGSITGGAKRRLMARARCVVITSRMAETSSLVAMEAMACGTPVLAFPVGALPNIVEHGKTGLIVKNEHELAAAFGSVRSLDRTLCRERAERRFDLRRTTSEYLALYGRLRKAPPAQM
ncbi:MAG TPA: glycosyltransferase [Polyangiaceae bacterium]|jgi:glycosyltransferase involved in cell wall biosynthesis|nr:glycosyltransferase [Polyangiaceae bacterium]